MDLRIQRTKSAIKSAFLELRETKAIEKITVTELTRLAKINKATFYLHYSDIYSLSDEIENTVIDEILADLPLEEKFFNDPQQYANHIFKAILSQRGKLDTLFSGSRNSYFSDKIEERIKAALYSIHPDYNTTKNDAILSFLIQGIFHTVKTPKMSGDMDTKYKELSKLCSMVIMLTDQPEK